MKRGLARRVLWVFDGENSKNPGLLANSRPSVGEIVRRDKTGKGRIGNPELAVSPFPRFLIAVAPLLIIGRCSTH